MILCTLILNTTFFIFKVCEHMSMQHLSQSTCIQSTKLYKINSTACKDNIRKIHVEHSSKHNVIQTKDIYRQAKMVQN